MKRCVLVACLLLAPLLLCACTDDLEQSLMVISFGVDAVDGQVMVCVKAPNYAASSSGGSEGGSGGSGGSGGGSGGSDGSGGGSGGEQGYVTICATGRDWAHAMSLLNASTPRQLRFSHLREIVIGQETAAGEGFHRLLKDINRIQNIDVHAFLIVCNGKACDFLDEQRSFIGIRLSKYLDLTLENYRQKGYITQSTLTSALRDLSGDWRDLVIAYAAVNKFENKDAPPQEQPVDQYAGNLPRQSVNAAEYVGGYAMGSRYDALLTGYEVQLLRLMRGQSQTLVFDYNGRYFQAEPRAGRTMRVREENGRLTLSLSLPVAVTYSMSGEAPDEGVSAFLEGEMLRLLGKLQAAGCDALAFGSVAARRFAAMPAWEAYNWPERYRQAALRVEVKAVTRQSNTL